MITTAEVAKDQLKSIVSRIERMEEEKSAISEDIKEIYAEAKGNGYDVKALRTIVKLRKIEPHDLEEQEAVLELYKSALGMVY